MATIGIIPEFSEEINFQFSEREVVEKGLCLPARDLVQHIPLPGLEGGWVNVKRVRYMLHGYWMAEKRFIIVPFFFTT